LSEQQKVDFDHLFPKDFRVKQTALALMLGLLLAGCAPVEEVASGNCDGVQVEVHFGILEAEQISTCVPIDGNEILAEDAFSAAGVEIEGTVTYPDQIVCRVNSLPSATEPIEIAGKEPYLETCADMPPEFAYWALWVKNSDDLQWEYATEGAKTLKLKSGQSVGLAFASGDQAPTPSE
jgi:hypothetical protein